MPVSLFRAARFSPISHSTKERSREREKNTTRNETKIKGAGYPLATHEQPSGSSRKEKEKRERKKRKENKKKKIHMRGKCVIRVGRTTGITRSGEQRAGNTTEKEKTRV